MAFLFLDVWRGELPYAVTQCGLLDSLALACGVCWRPDVCVVAETSRLSVVQDWFNQCGGGSKGYIEFVAFMAITLLKMKYDHCRLAEPFSLCFLCPQRFMI